MELVLSLALCVSCAVIGHLLFEMLTYKKGDKTGADMCTTCEHCIAIDGNGFRVTTGMVPSNSRMG